MQNRLRADKNELRSLSAVNIQEHTLTWRILHGPQCYNAEARLGEVGWPFFSPDFTSSFSPGTHLLLGSLTDYFFPNVGLFASLDVINIPSPIFKVTYSIDGGNGRNFFRIDNETGWVRTRGSNFDYEKQKFYVLRIMAADHGSPPQLSKLEYRIAVQDINEFWPQFVQQSYAFSVRANATTGTKIGTVSFDYDRSLIGAHLICCC